MASTAAAVLSSAIVLDSVDADTINNDVSAQTAVKTSIVASIPAVSSEDQVINVHAETYGGNRRLTLTQTTISFDLVLVPTAGQDASQLQADLVSQLTTAVSDDTLNTAMVANAPVGSALASATVNPAASNTQIKTITTIATQAPTTASPTTGAPTISNDTPTTAPSISSQPRSERRVSSQPSSQPSATPTMALSTTSQPTPAGFCVNNATYQDRYGQGCAAWAGYCALATQYGVDEANLISNCPVSCDPACSNSLSAPTLSPTASTPTLEPTFGEGSFETSFEIQLEGASLKTFTRSARANFKAVVCKALTTTFECIVLVHQNTDSNCICLYTTDRYPSHLLG